MLVTHPLLRQKESSMTPEQMRDRAIDLMQQSLH